MAQVRRAVVAGAGIAGLSVALGLQRSGVQTTVLERRRDPSRLLTGGGFMLWHNAMLALRQLKLEDAVEAGGSPIWWHEFRNDKDRRLARWDIRPHAERTGARALALRRSVLNEALLEAVGDSVRMGHRVTGFEDDGERVTVRTDSGERLHADILIGADGTWSQVRSALRRGHDMPPRYAGYTAWQAIAQLPGEDVVPSGTFFNLWGRGGLRFLYCRLSAEEVYWDAITCDHVSVGFDLAAGDRRAVLGEAFAGWPAPIPQIIVATAEEAVLPIDIADRPPERDHHWGRGRVALIGDAAHPMTLNLSQGAGQAIEDGLVLSRLLTGEGQEDVAGAVRDFERIRRPRVSQMTTMARRIGDLGCWHGETRCRVRDRFMRIAFSTVAERKTYGLMMDLPF